MSEWLGTWGRGSGKKGTEKKAFIITQSLLLRPDCSFLSRDMIRFQNKPVWLRVWGPAWGCSSGVSGGQGTRLERTFV